MKLSSRSITVDFQQIQEVEDRIQLAKRSFNTRKTYANSWKAFTEWCIVAGRQHLPAEAKTLQDFAAWSIAQLYRLQTISVRLNAIAYYHRQAGFQSPRTPALWQFMANAKRDQREQPAGKKALTYDMLLRMMPHFREDGVGVRNRAMILLAFASGWRRSEVVALRYRDLSFVSQGVELWQGSSKTDQSGRGRTVGIAWGRRPETCPVTALRKWLEVRGTWEGPLFVRFLPGHQGMSRIGLEPRGEVLHIALKAAVTKIGNPAEQFGAHSLRAGMITEAAKHGASESAIMQRTGHKSRETLQRYIRPATVFEFNPLAGVL